MMDDDLSIILELQSPFRWQPVIRPENRHEFDLEEENVGTFSFLNFCARIVQVYDEYMNRGKTSGNELLQYVDKHLQELEDSNCQDDLYTKCRDAIHHVFVACKTQMAIFGGKIDDEITEWMKGVKKFDDMNASNKSAMYAIKACVHSLYSNDGLDTSLSQINMALSYDKTTAYWMFLKGMILQKSRPTNESPSLQEREAFVAAYNTDNSNPLFMVYFADSLREMCKFRPKTYLWFIAKSAQVNAEDQINSKYETALELYRKSYELKPNCPVIAFKCANGLMRLPQKFQDVKLIKKIITDCENKFPNSGFGNLVCALYHERINKKIAPRQRCLEKCVELTVFNGCINSIRIDFAEKKDANIIERLEKMLDVFGEAARQEIIISQIISYYVFVAADIEKACEYMLEYYRKKSSGRHLEKHQSCFKMTDGPVSLVDVITDQVKIKLKDRLLPKEKRKFYHDFVRQMNFHNVEVLKGDPKNLLEQIQKSAVPKGKNPNKAHSNEAKRNSSSQQNRQSNDRSKYAPRNDARDRRGAGRSASSENVQRNNASPRRRDDRRPEDRRVDHQQASFDKRPDRRFGGSNLNCEIVQRNNASPRRRDDRHPEDKRIDNRPASFDKRPNNGFGGRAENKGRNDAGFERGDDHRCEERRGDDCRSEERRANLQPALASQRNAVVKTKATESDSNKEYQMLMDMCREGNRDNLDAIFEKWKSLSLKDSNKSRSEIPRTVPEEYDCQQANYGASKVQDKVSSRGRSRRSENHSLERQHRKLRKANEDVVASKDKGRELEDGSLEGRSRDRSSSKASNSSRRDKHRHRKPKESNEDVAASKERGCELEDGFLEDRRRDRSVSKSINVSHRDKHRHHKHKKPSYSSESEDERRHRRSESSSRRHRRHSNDRHGHKHRNSESASDAEKSVDKHRRKSHRKHRKSESPSDSERSADRKREKEKRSHHRSKKKHSSTERHEKHRSHRDHEKSSRRKKELKKGNSDSERSDSR